MGSPESESVLVYLKPTHTPDRGMPRRGAHLLESGGRGGYEDVHRMRGHAIYRYFVVSRYYS